VPGIRYVQVFENKGAIMGCSNPHPHSQIWATTHIPNEPAKELEAQKEYFQAQGRPLLLDYLAEEHAAQERILAENEHFSVLVPFWAVWPFETIVIAHRPGAGRLTDLTAEELHSLAQIMQTLTVRYDNLFEVSFPYSMGFHQAPFDGEDHPEWVLHAHFYPPLLRSAEVKKFMVGYEMLAMPQRDITPEVAAERLRSLPEIHFKSGDQHGSHFHSFATFEEEFGRNPADIVRSPGRVNLLGEHVDYNAGFVMPAAIDRASYLAFAPAQGGVSTLAALDMDERVSFTLDSVNQHQDVNGQPLPHWALYPAGVCWALAQAGYAVPALQAAFTSNIPQGSGLSSSASIELGFISAWQAIGGWTLPPMQRALLGKKGKTNTLGLIAASWINLPAPAAKRTGCCCWIAARWNGEHCLCRLSWPLW
jgi:hypothetical protein